MLGHKCTNDQDELNHKAGCWAVAIFKLQGDCEETGKGLKSSMVLLSAIFRSSKPLSSPTSRGTALHLAHSTCQLIFMALATWRSSSFSKVSRWIGPKKAAPSPLSGASGDGANWQVRFVHSTQEASKLPLEMDGAGGRGLCICDSVVFLRLFAKKVKKNETDSCMDAKFGEDCYWAVQWLLKTGIHQTPESFPELGKAPSFADAQLAFYNRAGHGCQRPCGLA